MKLLLYLWEIDIMSSNSVRNDTRDFVNRSYDCRPNWTPLSPVTIIY